MDETRDSRQTRLTGHDLPGDNSPLASQPGAEGGVSRPLANVASLTGSFGKYLVERCLGEGAMGTVYLATDSDLQRPVALKIPKFEAAATEEIRERFFVEARAAAALRHTNLCPVYEVGEIDGRCFLAMAYIDGRPLSDFVSPDHPLPVDQVATIITRLADGLAHAHSRDVVHRDLKPSNVIIDPQREPILTDFGLARQSGTPDAARLTGTGTILGSPAYMSPEQARGRLHEIGPRSDVYSLGVMFYELLTGRLPFEGGIAEVLAQVINDEPDPPSAIRQGLDPQLETICLDMMAKPLDRRTASAAEVAVEINAWLARQSDTATSSGIANLDAFDSSKAVGDARREQLENDRHLADALIGQGRLSMAARIVDAMSGVDDPRYREFSEWARSRKLDIQKSRRPGLVVSYTAADGTRFIDISGRLFRARTIWIATAIVMVTCLVTLEWYFNHSPPNDPVQLAVSQTTPTAPDNETPDDPTGETSNPGESEPGLPLPLTAQPPPTTPQPTPPAVSPRTDGPMVLSGHSEEVRQVVFSSDSRLLISGSEDSSVRIWDATSGRMLLNCTGHDDTVESVAINPAGSMIASGGADDLIRLWNPVTGKPLGILRGHEDTVTHVDFTSDGKTLVSASDDNTVRLWDLQARKETRLFNGHSDSVNVAEFNHDATRILSAGADTDVVLWNTTTGKQLSVLEGHTEEIWSGMFSPDGRQAVTSGDDHTIRIWDLATSKEVASLEGHTDEVNGVCFSPNGRLIASAGVDGLVKIWDAVAHTELATFKGHTDYLWDVAFSPDGTRLASASADATVRVWNVPQHLLAKILRGHSEPVGKVAVSPDGRELASCSMDQTVRLWDATSGRPGRVLAGHTHWVWGIAFGNSSDTLFSAGDNTLRQWNTRTGKEEQKVEVTDGQVRAFALDPKSQFAVIGDNAGRLTTWTLDTGRKLLSLSRHADEISDVAVSPDGRWIASCGLDGTLAIHSSSDGKLHRNLSGSKAKLQCLSFRPDSQHIAAGSHAGDVFVWMVADGTLQPGVADAGTDVIFRLAWTPDGKRLASAHGDGRLVVRQPGDPDDLITLEGHREGALSVCFHPRTGEMISSSFDHTIRMWPFLNASRSR